MDGKIRAVFDEFMNGNHSGNHTQPGPPIPHSTRPPAGMTVTNATDQFTMLSGDRSKIKDLLCSRLTECGWRDEVRLMCRTILCEKGANNSFTVEQLVSDVTPRARILVPDAVKKELLMKIRTILTEKENEDEENGVEPENEH